MSKFVASVIAGLVATVVGGLILSYLTNLQNPATSASRPKGRTYFATQVEAERVCGKDFWVIPDANHLPYYCD